jgi:hypothetical protein
VVKSRISTAHVATSNSPKSKSVIYEPQSQLHTPPVNKYNELNEIDFSLLQGSLKSMDSMVNLNNNRSSVRLSALTNDVATEGGSKIKRASLEDSLLTKRVYHSSIDNTL